MEEILKIHDFFGLNLQSIFIYYEIFFFKNWTQKALFFGGGGQKPLKMGKNTFFNVFDFLSRKREMTLLFLFHFSISYRLGYREKNSANSIREKKS